MGKNRKPNKLVVPALSKWLFPEPVIWDREVGGSNPLAPTNNFNSSLLSSFAPAFQVTLKEKKEV